MKRISRIAITASSLLFAACVPDVTTPDPEPSTTWYEDADGDGFGDENDAGTASTNQPAGYVADNTDCDDSAAAVNSDANEVNDEIDNDCDGVMNDAPFVAGQYGQAGGKVFYTFNAGMNGLEAAPADQDDGTGAEWGCYGTDITAAGSFTDGAQNTAYMLAANCSPLTGGNPLAVDLVSAYSLNGYSDWFLPSKDELNALYSQKAIVGGFAAAYYWSSSEYSANYAWGQHFDGGFQGDGNKDFLLRARAVRAF